MPKSLSLKGLDLSSASRRSSTPPARKAARHRSQLCFAHLQTAGSAFIVEAGSAWGSRSQHSARNSEDVQVCSDVNVISRTDDAMARRAEVLSLYRTILRTGRTWSGSEEVGLSKLVFSAVLAAEKACHRRVRYLKDVVGRCRNRNTSFKRQKNNSELIKARRKQNSRT